MNHVFMYSHLSQVEPPLGSATLSAGV
jgi:hypothetical protein